MHNTSHKLHQTARRSWVGKLSGLILHSIDAYSRKCRGCPVGVAGTWRSQDAVSPKFERSNTSEPWELGLTGIDCFPPPLPRTQRPEGFRLTCQGRGHLTKRMPASQPSYHGHRGLPRLHPRSGKGAKRGRQENVSRRVEEETTDSLVVPPKHSGPHGQLIRAGSVRQILSETFLTS